MMTVGMRAVAKDAKMVVMTVATMVAKKVVIKAAWMVVLKAATMVAKMDDYSAVKLVDSLVVWKVVKKAVLMVVY